MRTRRSIGATAAAVGISVAIGVTAPDAGAAEVAFNPSLHASYYWDGNTEIVQEAGETISDRVIRLSLSLPVRVSRPLWSFNTAYTVSGRLYNEREDNSDISQSLSLGYNRTLSDRNRFGVSASASRTENQEVEPEAPDRPITYVPRTARTNVRVSVNGSTDVSARSDITWGVSGFTSLYDDTSLLNYEDYQSLSADVGWSYRISEKTSSGFGYRYGRADYDERPDAQSHTVAWTGSTGTRKEVGVSYALGLIATDTGLGSDWQTYGGANVAIQWNPRPDHSLSAGVRQDVSAGRGLGGPTLDRGAYVGWNWSQFRGLGVAVTGGYWDREAIDADGDSTRSLYVSESVSWGFGEYLRLGVFHTYRDQSDDRGDPAAPIYETSYHSAGVNLGWTILGVRQDQ